MSPETALTPPAGFFLQDSRGAFSNHNGPYYYRPIAKGAEQAFFALPRHCNGFGLIHGGMLSAFLDGVTASAVFSATGTRAVTIHLSIDFLGMGRAGDWVLGEANCTRTTRDIAFVEGRAFVGERDLARVSGVFKLMRQRG